MVFAVSPEQVARDVALGFYTILVTFKFWAAFFLFRAYRRHRELEILLSLGLFCLFMGVSRTMLMICDFYVVEFEFSRYADHLLFYKLMWVLQAAGIAALVYSTEKSIFQGKDKYVISIFFLSCFGASLLVPDFLVVHVFMGICSAFVAFIPIAYWYTAYRAKGPIRTQSLLLAATFVLYATGALIISELFIGVLVSLVGSPYTAHAISAIVKMVGILLLGRAFYYLLTEVL